jgi:hypothetical protein
MPSIEAARPRKRDCLSRFFDAIAKIPVVGFAIVVVIGFFKELFRQLRMRKSSYKLALFFRVQTVFNMLGGILFLYVFLEFIAGESGYIRPDSSCDLPSLVSVRNPAGGRVFGERKSAQNGGGVQQRREAGYDGERSVFEQCSSVFGGTDADSRRAVCGVLRTVAESFPRVLVLQQPARGTDHREHRRLEDRLFGIRR